MTVPPRLPGGWWFPGDPPASDVPCEPPQPSTGDSRWWPRLSPTVPPPPPPAIPRNVRRLARRAVALLILVPLVLRVGSAIGGWFGPEPRLEADIPRRTVKVRDAADGRFWGLPPSDSVRVPETSDRR